MAAPEELNAQGIEYCQQGNLAKGMELFRDALNNNPRPATKMVVKHNLAFALCQLADIELGPGARVRINENNISYVEEAVKLWNEVCNIYQKEVEGTDEESAFHGPPSLNEYMKTAMNFGFALSVKLDQFRDAGISKSDKKHAETAIKSERLPASGSQEERSQQATGANEFKAENMLLPALKLKKAGRIEEAIAILKKLLEGTDLVEFRYMAAREIAFTRIDEFNKNEAQHENLFIYGTTEFEELYKYLTIAVEAYDKIDKSMQEGLNIQGFKEALARMDEIAKSAKTDTTAITIAKEFQSLPKEFPEGRVVIGSEKMVEHFKNYQPNLLKTFEPNDPNVIKEARNQARSTSTMLVYNNDTNQYQLYTLGDYKSPSSCFIATAVFGNAMAPEVIFLRQYRDDILYKTITGRTASFIYYLFSPSMAKIITKSAFLKKTIRILFLKPLIGILCYFYPNQTKYLKIRKEHQDGL